jgi:heptosyltransferase I
VRILLVRTSALGDIVHCLPVLTELRRRLPEAKLGWVVEASMAPLLAGHPDLDELLPVRLRPWRKRPLAAQTLRELGAFLAALRRFRADVALDLMGNHKSGVLARLSGARRRIGLARTDRREPSSAFWVNESVAARGVHAVERALSLLPALGLEPGPADFGAERLLAGSGPVGDAAVPEVLIHSGAGWANKVYPPERWAVVARRLAEHGLRIGVPLAPGEEELAARLVEASRGAAVPLPAGGLDRLVSLLRSTRILLGGDTGPVHLAHALGTPVLAVLGPTDPARHGPYGAPDSALAVRLPCSFCYKRFDGPRACLLNLDPETVAARALALLGRS